MSAQWEGSAVIAHFWQIAKVVRGRVTTSMLGVVCSPRFMDVVSRVPRPKIDHNHILFSQRLELSHDIIPQGQVEAPIRPARAISLSPL